MDAVQEIVKLIIYSPKRKAIFHPNSLKINQTVGTVKPLRRTRWTVRRAATGSVVEHYSAIMHTMQTVNETTRYMYEHGLKAGGVLTALEKFSILCDLD